MKKLIILFLLLPSLLFSQVSPSKIERIADANTVFGTALSYGTYLVVQSNNKTYKIISVNGVAGTAKLSDLVLNTDYIEEGSVTSVSTAAANNGVTATWSMATPTPALTIGLGAITPTSVNGLTLTALATGFTVAGGTTSKTLTVPLDASVSGTNTGDQTNITGNAANVTGIVAPANGGTGVANNAAMTVTGAGNFAYTRTLTAATNVTFPTTGTLSTLAGTETLTNKNLTSGTNTFPTFNQNTSGNAATVTTNANLTGEVTSVGNATTLGSFTSASLATALTDETGSGVAVLATSPTFVTPTLGVAFATTINKVTLTAPATASTLTVVDGKTLTASNTLTLTGIDGSSVAFGTGGTVAYTANNLSVFAATTSAQLAGVLSDETGSGAAVFGTSPILSTPEINGTITGTTVIPLANGGTGSATQNWVDLTTIQTAAGAKTWSALGTFSLGITSSGAAVNLNASSNFATNINTGTSSGDVFIGTGSGNVTIGNATGNIGVGGAAAGSYKLEVFGKLKTNAINETSDERYKKDIVTVNNALSKVMALRGVNYLWKIDEFPKNNFDNTLQIGLIAQEIEKIVPEVVRTDEKGFKSVEYSKLVALLIEAIKEQQKTIDQQKLDITNMKSDAGRIKKLEADMLNLKLQIEGLNKDTKPVKKEK